MNQQVCLLVKISPCQDLQGVTHLRLLSDLFYGEVTLN